MMRARFCADLPAAVAGAGAAPSLTLPARGRVPGGVFGVALPQAQPDTSPLGRQAGRGVSSERRLLDSSSERCPHPELVEGWAADAGPASWFDRLTMRLRGERMTFAGDAAA